MVVDDINMANSKKGSTAQSVDAADDTYVTDTDTNEKMVSVFGRCMPQSDLIKFGGLIAFFVVLVVICCVMWSTIKDLFAQDSFNAVLDEVQSTGVRGILFLLAIEFLQVVVAFIPGEVVQIAAGLVYGPWLGSLIVLLGCVISSAFVFVLVHKLGAPFVQAMVSTRHLEQFRAFEKTGKLNIIVFMLFFIPGLPKDVFTYLVPLTDMPMKTFVLISNTARIPGIFVSTYAANSIAEGDYVESIIIFAIAAVIALIGALCKDKLLNLLAKVSKR